MTVRFQDVYSGDGEPRPIAVVLLHRLLAERPPEANISHAKLPSVEEHLAFVRSKPYRFWFMVMNVDRQEGDREVGALYATHANEIGIFILRDAQHSGFARLAIERFLGEFEPLPTGRGTWLANVSPKNYRSKQLFEHLDGHVVQITYEIPKKRKT